jgi:uncharacterized protein YhaN
MTDLQSEIEEKRATLTELTASVENLPTRRAEWDLLEKELADLDDRIELKKATVKSLEDTERALENATVPSPPVTRSRTHNRPMSVALWLRRLSEGSLPPPAPVIQASIRSKASGNRGRKMYSTTTHLVPQKHLP